MPDIEKLRGFRDYYPDDEMIREELFQKMREVAKAYGFQPIDYPSLEYLKMFQIKSGDELVSQTYNFKDKGEREITLIPEATPSTVRMLIQKKEISRPVKWYNIPKLWRYEEPQSGRNREHYQFNCDFFGEPTEQGDLEVISVACQLLDSIGLKGKYEVRLNERKLMEHILSHYGAIDPVGCLPIIDRLRKEDRSITEERLLEKGIEGKNLKELMEFLLGRYSLVSIQAERFKKFYENKEFLYIVKLMTRLKENGLEDVVFDPGTVRGLSYYTGIVFEGFDKSGKFRSIFGGGRYDNLSSLFGGQEIPAVGFGMGDAVIENIMRDHGLWKPNEQGGRYYIIGKGKSGTELSYRVASQLRKRNIITELDVSDRNISKTIAKAVSRNFSIALIIGEREALENKLKLKDLRTKKQEEFSVEEFLKTIKDF